MKKHRRKTGKALRKSLRKALKRHSIATGVATGVATALVLSSTGIAQRLSEASGEALANLFRVRPRGFFNGIRTRTGAAMTRAGEFFHRTPEPEGTMSLDAPAEEVSGRKHHRSPADELDLPWFSWGNMIKQFFPKRTRKAVRKAIRKVLRKHGPEFAAAIVTGVATSLLHAMHPGKKKKKRKKH